MKLLFLISSKGHGKGGHFHDLNTIASALGNNNEVYIINFGYKKSEVFDSLNYRTYFIKYNGYNFLKVLLKAKTIITELRPDVINAFDLESFAFSRLFSLRFKQQNFLTKCGGPNPKRYFPKMDNLILVSEENLKYFKTRSRYKYASFVLIPDRVKKIKVDKLRIRQFKEKHVLSKYTILRINRIAPHYKSTMIQSINLTRWLIERGLDVKLVIIGTIQNHEILDNILDSIKSNNLKDNVIIESSDVFTHNASELVDIGDAVIGTGRNFMEACSLNKLVLVPYNVGCYPLLVSESNFEDVLVSNFSPRTRLDDFSSEFNLNNIYNAFNVTRGQNSLDWFKEYFDVNKGALKYLAFYEENCGKKSSNYIDIIINILYSIKSFVFK